MAGTTERTRIEAGRGERLELRVGSLPDGPRYFLGGRAVGNGARLELLLGDGQWIHGLFEWSGVELRWPGLRVALGRGSDEPDAPRPAYAVLALHPDAVLRWPTGR